MTVIATILKPGLQTTLQDGGRPGFRHLGVPLSGAADRLSFALANAALGNAISTSAFECALSGPTMKFEAETTFCITGAVMDASLNGAPVAAYKTVTAKVGDTLALGAAKTGARAYLAISGGVKGESFLGSTAVYLPANIGAALKEGDQLYSAGLKTGTPIDIPPSLHFKATHDFILRATPGPEANQLAPENLRAFFKQAFLVDQRTNRMGARLTGQTISLPEQGSMKSSAVFPGTVQCPADGAPILLLCDAQTTGGYPRIAQVIAADLPLAGQLRAGDKVWFQKVEEEKGRDITLKKQALINAVLPGFSFY